MKSRMRMGWMAIAAISLVCAIAWADPMDDLMDRYDQEFDAVKPEAGSSVRSDYKFDQIAMGGMYTARSLQLIYQQNRTLIEKQNALAQKYDTMIEQNKEIIRLLKIISETGTLKMP